MAGRVGIARLLGICVAAVLIFVLLYPPAQQAYDRYLVSERLRSIMTAQERAEYRNWSGDASSFAQHLYDRCGSTQGLGAVQCQRFRYALR